MKLSLIAVISLLFLVQPPQRLMRVTLVFEPRFTPADSVMIVASFRDGVVKALAAGPPILAGGKVTQSAARATMVVGLVNAATGAILARDSVSARIPVLRDSARVLGARLAGRVH